MSTSTVTSGLQIHSQSVASLQPTPSLSLPTRIQAAVTRSLLALTLYPLQTAVFVFKAAWVRKSEASRLCEDTSLIDKVRLGWALSGLSTDFALTMTTRLTRYEGVSEKLLFIRALTHQPLSKEEWNQVWVLLSKITWVTLRQDQVDELVSHFVRAGADLNQEITASFQSHSTEERTEVRAAGALSFAAFAAHRNSPAGRVEQVLMEQESATQVAPRNPPAWGLVRALLKQEGLDLNQVVHIHEGSSEKTRSALHYAAYLGVLDIVQTLVEKGANKEASFDFSGTPIKTAAKQLQFDVVRYLKEKQANTKEVSEALTVQLWCRQDFFTEQQLEDCFACGLQPETRYNVLIFAAKRGLYTCVQKLLDRGFDPFARNKDGKVVFAIARDVKILELFLLHRRLDVTKPRPGTQHSVLLEAVFLGVSDEVYAHLISRGARAPDINNSLPKLKGRTPLQWALGRKAGEYREKVLARLKELGAQENPV